MLCDSPTDVECPTWTQQRDQRGHRLTDPCRFKMHDHGLANHVLVGTALEPIKLRQGPLLKRESWISRSRLIQQTLGSVDAESLEAVFSQPRGIAARTASNVRGGCAP